MLNGKISIEDIVKSIEINIKAGPLLGPVTMDVSMPVSLPLKRKQIKKCNPMTKSIVWVYEDELQKQIYGNLTNHLNPSSFKPNT